jgi:hypothetical protein
MIMRTHFEADVPCETFSDPLGKGSRLMVLLPPVVVAPSLGFPRAPLGLEMGTSRREATGSEVSFLFVALSFSMTSELGHSRP